MSVDGATAVALCLADPRLGGAILRGDDMMAMIEAGAAGAPVVRVPIAAETDAMDDGIDVAASLGRGRPVVRPGLVARAAGGLLVAALPSRLAPPTVAMLARAADAGTPVIVLAEVDEAVPATLADRLAFDLAGPIDTTDAVPPGAAPIDAIAAIADAAAMLGVSSSRIALLAVRLAHAVAGERPVDAQDVALAVAAVLLPRATQLPAALPAPPDAPDAAPPPATGTTDAERLVAAAAASLPADLLARLAGRVATGKAGRGRDAARGRGAGGRPLAARAGVPRGTARLALIETLAAAAPWQRARGRGDGRVLLRCDDLRVRRRKPRAGPTTVFAVDASGSAAAARLAEAKGAVELLLARAHVARAEVALVAFRGQRAELLLPPTRSLTRARRLLADLPGGGGTPLAAGLEAARQVALAARSRGRQPQLVVLTDGRANVAEGDPGAAADAAARAIAGDGLAAVLIDIASRPRPEGARIASAMRARYVALPRGDAAALEAAVAR